MLERIEIPPSFHKWTIKQLQEEHAKEQVDRDEITKTHQKEMEECIRRLDNLFNMRMNEEISAEEYAIKKDALLAEKQKYEHLIADTNQRIETWLSRAEDLFSFAQTARQRFEVGSLEDKRAILTCLGSNLLLSNRIVEFNVDKSFCILKKLAPEVQAFHNRLEPLQSEAPPRVLEGSLYKK